MERNKTRRAVELGKDALILLLTVSALWLAAQTPLAAPLRSLLREEGGQAAPGQVQAGDWGLGAVPMAMVVNLTGGPGLPDGTEMPGGAEGVRCGLRYDQAACQELFQRVASPLAEVLSSAGAPERISRSQWERALTSAFGVYMDFQGQIPMPVLAGWLSGGETGLNATVRRLILTAEEGRVNLYYRDEADGSCYRCHSEVADPYSLSGALTGLTDNGAFYAFESEQYQELDPDTLLLPDTPAPEIYTAANPVSGGQGALESLVQDMGFSLNSTSFYSTDEQVARSGDDSVRLSDWGMAQYLYEGKGGAGLFPVLRQGDAGTLFDSVETCRRLALSAMGTRCGEARLYLMSAVRTDEGWEVSFGYSLNGIPVLLDRGYAARFLVAEGQIVQFSLQLRSYTASGSTQPVLPPRQGAAAAAAKNLRGAELLLTYTDSGSDTLAAGWSAKTGGPGEE